MSDEYDRPPMPFVPRGPIRHAIRWIAVTHCTVMALYQASQVVLTADTPFEVVLRALAALILAFTALGLANRWYRPSHER